MLPCLQDGFEQLNKLGEDLKSRIQIRFIDQHGLEEAGIDGGGLFKEFMECLVKEGFDPNAALFKPTSDNRLYPNPAAQGLVPNALAFFEFLGRMLGKAMYEVRPSTPWLMPAAFYPSRLFTCRQSSLVFVMKPILGQFKASDPSVHFPLLTSPQHVEQLYLMLTAIAPDADCNSTCICPLSDPLVSLKPFPGLHYFPCLCLRFSDLVLLNTFASSQITTSLLHVAFSCCFLPWCLCCLLPAALCHALFFTAFLHCFCLIAFFDALPAFADEAATGP